MDPTIIFGLSIVIIFILVLAIEWAKAQFLAFLYSFALVLLIGSGTYALGQSPLVSDSGSSASPPSTDGSSKSLS